MLCRDGGGGIGTPAAYPAGLGGGGPILLLLVLLLDTVVVIVGADVTVLALKGCEEGGIDTVGCTGGGEKGATGGVCRRSGLVELLIPPTAVVWGEGNCCKEELLSVATAVGAAVVGGGAFSCDKLIAAIPAPVASQVSKGAAFEI